MPLPSCPSPMLALLSPSLPEGAFQYEPKWDGFRVVVARDGDDVELLSRDGKPLGRFFPELLGPLREALPLRAVVDGEIVLVGERGLLFDVLQLRLHPAASRIQKLAAETPASVVLWDLLQSGDEALGDRPLSERRARLEADVKPNRTVTLTPATRDAEVARDWFARFRGAGLDGVIAKALDGVYEPGRRGWIKVKHENTLDVVVAGFRWHKDAVGAEVGSLVLALYDDKGALHPIGVASSFTKKRRVSLVEELSAWLGEFADHPWAAWGEAAHRPDQGSRWSAGKDLSWVPLRPGLVAEVHTTQHDSRRLRHPAHLVRFRDDKPAASCRLDQLSADPAPELVELLR